MTIIELKKKFYTVPTTWNELTGKQLIRVMEVLYGGYEVNTAQLKLLKILSGISWYRFFRVSIKEKSEYLYLIHFLVNENTLTKQLLPSYRGYIGPADDFNNLTGEEFVFSEDFYFKSFSRENPEEPRTIHIEALDQLVAVLYRPAKKNYNLERNPDGDARQPFNQNLCAYNASHVIRTWSIFAKLAIFTLYEACRQRMIESNPDIFSGGSSEPAKYGLLSVMRVIAEGGIHGTFEQVQKMHVHLWMMELNEKYEEAKREEKNSK